MSMKRFSAPSFKEALYSRRAYDIPHSLLSRRSPEEVLALLSVEEPEKRLLSAVFPAEKGPVTNLTGFFEALVEHLAVNDYFGLNIGIVLFVPGCSGSVIPAIVTIGKSVLVQLVSRCPFDPLKTIEICSLTLHHERSPNIWALASSWDSSTILSFG